MLSLKRSHLVKNVTMISKVALMDYFWSVKHHRVVKGINENLKFIRRQKLNFIFGVESNRIISSELSNLESVTKIDFDRLHNAHWGVERFHPAIKQVCNIERFQVRNENPIKNHIFCALNAFVRLELMRFKKNISHWYEIRKNLFLETIRNFIAHTSKSYHAVNA